VVNEIINQFRLAVSSGEFQKAALLWNDYSREIEDEIRRRACNKERFREAAELLEWARRVALCARTSATRRLSATQSGTQVAGAYSRIAQDRR
jgi:hypothetical protein